VRLGVKNFNLIDRDVFEITNLNRQLLSNEYNLGKNKTDEAAKRVKLIDKEVQIKVFKEVLDENSLHLLEGTQIVLDGLDSISSKLNLEKLCHKMGLPLIHGAISGYLGQVALSTPENRIVHKIYKDNLDYPNTLGNLPITCMVTASLQCNLVLKLLFKKIVEDELIFVNVEDMTIDKIKIDLE
jgi:molybdopterin/thiamine biosynthesis adenylyltransferase